MEEINYIYKTTLLIGNLKNHYYIGKRKFKLPKYFQLIEDKQKYIQNNPLSDFYIGSGKILKSYIKKYGKIENITFKKEILEIEPDLKTCNIREHDIIGDLWKNDPLCINLIAGGGGVIDGSLPSKLIKEYYKNNTNPNKGKKLSAITKQKISNTQKIRMSNELYRKNLSNSLKSFYKTHPSKNLGKHLSPEQKENLSKKLKNKPNLKNKGKLNGMYGKIPANAKKIIRYDINHNIINIYNSLAEAGSSINSHPSNLCKYIKSGKIYHDSYWKYK